MADEGRQTLDELTEPLLSSREDGQEAYGKPISVTMAYYIY